jgi:type I restriction enzyme S subunit
MSPKYQETLNELKVGSSDSSVSIGNNQVLDLEIPVPPIGVQQLLVDIMEGGLSADNRLHEALTAQLTRISELRRSLLHAAFTGQLTKESTRV